MTRSLTPAFSAELVKGEIKPAFIAELDTSGGEVLVWTGIGDLNFNSKIYTGLGDLIGIAPVRESGQDVRANVVSFTLSGVPSSAIATALGTQYQGRTVKLWLAVFDDAGLIANPALIFHGRADVMVINEGPETSVITVTAESHLADLTRPRVRRYTHEDQQELHPGDMGLEFVTSIQNTEVIWSE